MTKSNDIGCDRNSNKIITSRTFICLEKITEVDHDSITFHTSTNPATMGRSIYIKLSTKWVKLILFYLKKCSTSKH